jgi:hypothetical protein
VIERDQPKNFSVFSKVKIAFKPDDIPATTPTATTAAATEEKQEAWGEIEITFSPIKRQ